MEQEKKKNSKIVFFVIGIIFFSIIAVGLVVMNLSKNILEEVYTGNEITQRVNENNKLTEYQKQLYNNAVARNDENLLLNKTIEVIIQEEQKRQDEELKAKERQEQIKKIEKKSSEKLLSVMNRTFKNYMNGIDTFTYTFRIKDINFEQIRMYYDDMLKALNEFKESISQYEELTEKNSQIIEKLNQYIDLFDKATTETSSVDSFIDCFDELSNKYTVCYETLFKNVSNGKDIYEYIEQ